MDVKGLTKALAEFIVSAKYEDFSEGDVNYIKDLGLGFMAAQLWGSTLSGSKVPIRFVQSQGGPPEAGVMGAGFKVPVPNAAFANGFTLHEAEIEGNIWPEAANPMTIWPVVFALGEKLKISGRDAIEAFIIAQEVQSRLGRGLHRGVLPRGFFQLSLYGTFGAGAAAAKLLKLNVDQTREVLSIAASSTSGLMRQVGTMVHYLESSMSCRDGVIAALLVQDGHTADKEMLDDVEGSWPGFCTCYSTPVEVDVDSILKGLGKPPFRVQETGSKYYPCCDFQQRLIYGAVELVKKHKINYQDVESVTVESNTTLGKHLHYSDPKNYEETRFSIQHGIAAALIDVEVGPHGFSDESAVDPRFIETRRKVKVVIHPEWDSAAQSGFDICTIKLKNGKQYRQECRMGGGSHQSLSHERALAKFRNYTVNILTPKQAGKAEELMVKLDKLTDITELADLMTFAGNS
jgi:2-methylcitrate dehydratase PrpD